MTNPYYTAGTFSAHTIARASAVQTEFARIEAGFEDLSTALNDWGNATSTSNLTIGTGSKSLTIEGGHFIQTGQNVVISMQSDATAYMTGQITSYDPVTGATVVDVTDDNGAGSASAWNIGLIPFGESTRIVGYTGAQTIAQLKTAMDIAAVTDAALALKSPLASPTFTGTPAAPTASVGTDSTQIATTAFVQDELDARAGQHIVQAANRTLTSTTAVQKLFDTAANGTLTLAAGRYEFSAMLYLSGMSGTSGNGAFHLRGAGTATLANILQASAGKDVIGPGFPAVALTGAISTAQNNASAEADINSVLTSSFHGAFTVSAGGTVIPSFALTTAAAAVLNAGSYFVCRRLGAANYSSDWS
jgi:hypothetical protein